MSQSADIGLIGLAVMGQNLVLNMEDHGFEVAVFNRTVSKVEEFIEGNAKGKKIKGARDLQEFFALLKRPRKVMFMVKAGQPVDDLIEECLPFLEKGDVIIDGGNSHFPDSERRCQELAKKGILFVGAGVSGGEEGARHGPSIMPGGNPAAWPLIQPIFQAIAAKADDGSPCCSWVGEGGSGHYVKMVHNGIEYGDMQLICEAYHVLKNLGQLSYDELGSIFSRWNQGPLSSYLIEISAKIFHYKDQDGTFLVEKILDVAGQKGTGKWTAISALDQGMPLTLIGEAVFARCLSSLKDERTQMSQLYTSDIKPFTGNREALIQEVEQALYASKIISYAQGFMLMRAASTEMKWHLDYGAIALMWRGGCIIRSAFLTDIKKAFQNNKDLPSLLFDPFFKQAIEKALPDWRQSVMHAALHGIPTPCFSTALAFFDGYRLERLPANLLQAQRDFFGAHTYERIDNPRGKYFHTNWTGTGGNTTSGSYNA